jgi:hypothetical protein
MVLKTAKVFEYKFENRFKKKRGTLSLSPSLAAQLPPSLTSPWRSPTTQH